MLKNCFNLQANSQSTCASVSLLFLRVVTGVAFMLHGWGKIQTPFAWMGPDAKVPGFLQGLAALSEFGGGLALVLGFVTPLAALGLICTMGYAVYLHSMVLKDPFVASSKGGGSYELALVYLAVNKLFLSMGPGKFSLDAKVFGEKK